MCRGVYTPDNSHTHDQNQIRASYDSHGQVWLYCKYRDIDGHYVTSLTFARIRVS